MYTPEQLRGYTDAEIERAIWAKSVGIKLDQLIEEKTRREQSKARTRRGLVEYASTPDYSYWPPRDRYEIVINPEDHVLTVVDGQGRITIKTRQFKVTEIS